MEGFKVNFKTSSLDFKLEIDNLGDNDKEFVREILMMIDRKTTTPVEQIGRDQLKEKYKNYAEGYNALTTDIGGFHYGVDEYIAQEVEQEIENKIENEIDTKIEQTVQDKIIQEFENKIEVKIENGLEDTVQLDSSKVKIELVKEENEEVEKKDKEDSEIEKKENEEKKPFTHYGLTDDPSIRLNAQNEKLFQTYYVCPKCKNKGKRFIPKYAFQTNCHTCGFKMRVKPASFKGFPEPDRFGNILVAGEFRPNLDSQIPKEEAEEVEEKN